VALASDDRFALLWLGGFTIVGAIVAAVAFAVLFAGETILYLLAIAVPGAIVGFLKGVGVAQVIVVVAEELGWSPPPEPSSVAPRLGRFLTRLDELLEKAGQ
jgi:hypothetical protein